MLLTSQKTFAALAVQALVSLQILATDALADSTDLIDSHSAPVHDIAKVQPLFVVTFEQQSDQDNAELSAWAERTRLDLAANYPPIYDQMLSPSAKPAESIELVFYRKDDGSIAYAEGGRININCAYVEQHYDDIGMPIHELVHIVQSYSGGDCPGWLTEGIADWIRYFWYEKKTLADYKGQDPGNYDSAYGQTARFLEWLRENRNPDIVPVLNARLREQQYNQQCFSELCGAKVEDLWNDYLTWLAKQG